MACSMAALRVEYTSVPMEATNGTANRATRATSRHTVASNRCRPVSKGLEFHGRATHSRLNHPLRGASPITDLVRSMSLRF